MRLVPNQDDLNALLAQFEEAATKAGSDLLVQAAEEAVRRLHDLDVEAGHRELALLWDHTDVEPQPDGSLLIEAFSHAETMTFYDKTSRAGIGRVTSTKYPISGAALLSILESGAKAHSITADTAESLVFPAKGFEEAVLARSHGPGDFTPGDTSEEAFIFTKSVDHPGVQANQHIEKTTEELMNELEGMAEKAAEELAEIFNG